MGWACAGSRLPFVPDLAHFGERRSQVLDPSVFFSAAPSLQPNLAHRESELFGVENAGKGQVRYGLGGGRLESGSSACLGVPGASVGTCCLRWLEQLDFLLCPIPGCFDSTAAFFLSVLLISTTAFSTSIALAVPGCHAVNERPARKLGRHVLSRNTLAVCQQAETKHAAPD